MSGMIDLNQEHYQKKDVLIRKIELMKGEIGLIDSFRLCNIYMNIYPDGGNVKPQPERNFSIEKDLITMYQELKKLV
jgi:hypothetical protein